ncbi:hypothetical protein GUITHDRAFT_160183, partial [Guillardia theta CCMP2712]
MIALGKALCLVACFVGAQGFLPAQPFIARKGWNDAASALPLRKAISCRLPSASRQRFTATRMAVEEESLQRLVDSKGRRYIIVGGKGGVGKTSTSAALAVKLADEGLRTLVISTDPAHSLGDALMTDLSKGKVTPVAEQGGNLYALEVDLKEAIEEFKAVIKSLKGSEDVDSIASKLGLSEMTDIFDVPPPGADELVALSKIISLVEEGEAKTALGQVVKSSNFDRVIVDTAPTGHTLRLLSFPEFLDSFLQKVLALKRRLDGAINTAKSLFGLKSFDDIEDAARAIERYREEAEELRKLLTDKDRTQFVGVSIASALSFAESERLVQGLKERGVAIDNLVVNQLLGDASDPAAVARIVKAQAKCIKELEDLSASAPLEQPDAHPIWLNQVPFFDSELRSVYALRALSNALFSSKISV